MRPIRTCLNPTLTMIFKRVAELETLSTQVHAYFSSHLSSGHTIPCAVGSFNQGCLTLVVTQSIWASELRYHLPALRDYLRQEAKLHQLATIKIKLEPASESNPSISLKQTRRSQLSLETRQYILESGQQTLYAPLQEALIKLSGLSVRDKLIK